MRKNPISPALKSLLDAFGEVPDPRVARTRAHPLVNILCMALLGAISGADGWEDLELFAEQRAEFFGTFLSMPKGHPSADGRLARRTSALISRYALSILKRDSTKRSVAQKRRKAAWSDTYFIEVLGNRFLEI